MTLYIKTADGWKVWLAAYKVCDNHNKLEGVYRNPQIEDVQQELDVRIDLFLAANGVQSMAEKQSHFRGNSFILPLHGAFGEKL